MFQGLPRTLIAFGAVLIVILELWSRLPDILLLPQRLQGQAGELGAKAMQPQVVTTQVAKTEADTRLADAQAQLNAMQVGKTQAETRLADAQAQLNTIQQAKVVAETEVTKLQAMVTAMQVAKTQADTRLADTQAALAASQVTKTEADTRLADAQTNQTNITASQQRIGLAITTGLLGLFTGAGQPAQQTTQQTEQQPASSPFETGRADWHQYYDWASKLPAEQKAGVKYWEIARVRNPNSKCEDAPKAASADFSKGCSVAKRFLTEVDAQRAANDDYRNGFTAGYKDTGNF